MRLARMAVIVALLLAYPAPPAAAHSCAAPGTAEVGQTAAVTIGVTAELEPIVAIDVQVPSGFTLAGKASAPSWQVAGDDKTLRFTGGRVEPFNCGYVTVRGRAARKGRLVFPVTVTAEDGTSTRYTETDWALPNAAGLLFVGVEPSVDGTSDDGGGSGAPTLIAAAIALGLGGVIVAWRRLRRPQPTARPTGRAPARRASGSSRPGKRKRPPPRRK